MQIAILKKSDVHRENVTYRIDAEFFQKDYLDAIKSVEKNNYLYVEEISSWVTQGPNPSFCEDGIPCLTGRNINKGEVSYINPDYVNDDEYKKLSRYQLSVGDTLITLKGKGSIGKVGYVTDDRAAIFTRDVGVIRPSNIDSGFLNIYFLCKYGKLLVDRGETGGTGQSTLTTSYLKSIPVPRFSNEEQIGKILKEVERLKKRSSRIYKEALSLLLSEIGLTYWQPKHQLTFIKNYSDTQQAGRIDAEYYQPKYEEIINAIKSYSGGWDTLDELLTLKNKNFKPKDKEQYKYMELANIAGNGEITDCMLEEGQDLPTRARRKVATGNVIISSIEGSLTSIALIEQEYNQSLCSTGFHVINSKLFNSETLLVLLKSIVGQLQLKKGCSGTILTAINKEEFKKIILPKVSESKQIEIQKKVIDSFNLRKQSKHLLECAKKAVEIAIEKDEQTAINWLESKTREMQI
ncbi:restriction endonuclease subunit S, partial [Nitrospira defluvii]|nr:restriction endonuclease subunit S [Nitrospira defluvii]